MTDPQGRIIAWQRKKWLTKEAAFCEPSDERKVFPVKGLKMGLAICADGSDFLLLRDLVQKGAQIIYAPHAN